MNLVTLLLTAVALSADAFAVSVAKGLRMRQLVWRPALAIALTFGAFQGIMPVIGWALGSRLANVIEPWDHWVAFALLAAVGAKMIWEARAAAEPAVENAGENAAEPRFTIGARELMILGVATSIDALAVGVSLAFVEASIIAAALIIGAVTFASSMLGIRLGHHAGAWLSRGAELAGGLVLVGIGVKILAEHLLG